MFFNATPDMLCPPAPVTSIDGGPDLYVGLHSRLSLVCRIDSGGLQPRHLIWRKGHKVECRSARCSWSVEVLDCWSVEVLDVPGVLKCWSVEERTTLLGIHDCAKGKKCLDQRPKPSSGAGSWSA